jgi:topoisomerase-4 subunit A
VWFDHDVQRLNYDNRGDYLGEFHSDDLILVVLKNGEFYTTNFDINNHYEQNILRIEKFDEQKVWTAVLFDADQQGFPYIKRFTMERTSSSRHFSFIGENPKSELLLLSDITYPRILVTHGGVDSFREPVEIDAEQFIGTKSFKAKGKRITTLEVAEVKELEPLRFPEPKDEEVGEEPEELEETDDDENPNDVRDALIGQLHFDLE